MRASICLLVADLAEIPMQAGNRPMTCICQVWVQMFIYLVELLKLMGKISREIYFHRWQVGWDIIMLVFYVGFLCWKDLLVNGNYRPSNMLFQWEQILKVGSHLLNRRSQSLHGCQHKVIPDRIEAGTYMIACALAGEITIDGINTHGSSWSIKNFGITVLP